jgi:arylsulfatase A-like enzyme
MKQNPNILLIVMDAVRADHLSCYGYKRPTTPFLEEMAADGVIFDNAFAAAPWTPPSHASLFTGTYPSKHGVDVDENLYLHDGNVTLAQILGSSGHRTFAILPDAHLSDKRGFHRGFQDYIEVFRLPYLKFDFAYLESSARNLLLGRDKRSYLINRLVKRWLTQNAVKDEPFFVFVNYKTAHNRYQAPWPFRKRFEVKPDPDQDKKKLDYFSDGGGYPYMARKFEMSAGDFEVVKSWYDGAVACIDDRIRDLVQYLKKIKLYENTLIIVTADHGENFGEHGLAYHLFCLYDTLIRVPLVFHAPALFRGPIRVPHLVSLTDVLPTLLDILRIDSNRRREIDGRSLLPFDGRPYHSHIFSEFDRPTWMLKNLATRFPGCDFSHLGRGLRCVRTAEHKLIVRSDGRHELYHLPSDPGETRNLIEQNPEEANILQRTLEDWLASSKMSEVSVPPKEDDALILKNLRDLGYV